MAPLCFAYYCSGHGYGHATRVSAFACHLLSLPESERPTIHIVSSAPKHVFADSLARGALYRHAEIDPVIVQPLAYRVDRQKSVDVLKRFLSTKDAKLEEERAWLLDIGAHSVLSDAAFLGCLAAKLAGIPSILITNFTFDSVYSYLSTSLLDAPSSPSMEPSQLHPTNHEHPFTSLIPDIPVLASSLAPLVSQIHTGYRHADLLLLLPGSIPIPSFSTYPALPSPDWIDPKLNKFHPEIIEVLSNPLSCTIHPSVPSSPPSPLNTSSPSKSKPSRTIVPTPLLVRPPTSSSNANPYTPTGRSALLTSIGVPPHLQDSTTTKILIVSFGGQIFRRPSSRSGSRSPSWNGSSRDQSPDREHGNGPFMYNDISSPQKPRYTVNGLGIVGTSDCDPPNVNLPQKPLKNHNPPSLQLSEGSNPVSTATPRLTTTSHIWIPGAPPAFKPLSTLATTSPISPRIPIPTFTTSPPTPTHQAGYFDSNQTFPLNETETDGPRLLPDASWIAIVCGVSKEEWQGDCGEGGDDLPEGFFVAPRDVYMPDLTAVGDVLLGKLGYGTVSECVDACTPFVYVSRPLFIEEHGLRLLLSREGVGIELSRQAYELGEWACAVQEAWAKGRDAKMRKRKAMAMGIGRAEGEGMGMAKSVVKWVEAWWDAEDDDEAET